MSDVLLEKSGNVATITINRPKSLNALNQNVISLLSEMVKDLESDAGVSIVKVTGSGDKAFVAGADISQMQGMDEAAADAFAQAGQQVFLDIENSTKIFIACVKGFALGGGCELALACDLIYANTKAVFGLPEVSLGLIPGFGGTQRLSRLVGSAKAKEMIYTGKMVDASNALNIGLAAQVFEDGDFEMQVDKVIGKILKNGSFALARAKQAVNEGAEKEMVEAMKIEKRHFAHCFSSSQALEGMSAFLEKRKPNWNK